MAYLTHNVTLLYGIQTPPLNGGVVCGRGWYHASRVFHETYSHLHRPAHRQNLQLPPGGRRRTGGRCRWGRVVHHLRHHQRKLRGGSPHWSVLHRTHHGVAIYALCVGFSPHNHTSIPRALPTEWLRETRRRCRRIKHRRVEVLPLLWQNLCIKTIIKTSTMTTQQAAVTITVILVIAGLIAYACFLAHSAMPLLAIAGPLLAIVVVVVILISL